MTIQDDFFEHSLNSRLMELRRKVMAREEEIRRLREEIQQVSSNLRGVPISEDGRTKIVVGPNRRLYLVSEEGSENKVFIPISLDRLLLGVQELTQTGTEGNDPFSD